MGRPWRQAFGAVSLASNGAQRVRHAEAPQADTTSGERSQAAFKDSMIHKVMQFHTIYRTLLRSSSLREPRDPLLKVVSFALHADAKLAHTCLHHRQ